MNLSGKNVLVTGANRGIGLALVEALLGRGVETIYATYRSSANRATLESLGDRVVPVPMILGDVTTIQELPNAVKSLDVLINNAGIFTGADLLADTEQDLRNDLETNLFGTLAVSKALLPILERSGSAAIANVASVAALGAMPGFGGYSISKAAVHSMTQSLRGKLKNSNVSVHGIYPGPVATRMTEGVDMPTTPANVVAANILDGIEKGTEYIFPDGMSEQLGSAYLQSPVSLEQAASDF
ncbi:MAG: SDR family NAD(P)-dependent oxidoreductase [Pseudomonadota bacterium]